MMLTQQTATFFISTIALLLAYFVITTIANCFKAWVAHTMGDDTGVALGFFNFNPLVHVDPIGIILIPLLQFGWGQQVPVNPLNIHGKWRKTKTACAFLADSLAYIMIATVALVALILMFNVRIIGLTQQMILYRVFSHHLVAQAYPAYSSLTVSVGFVLIGIMYLSAILSVLQGVINAVYLGALFIARKKPHLVIDRGTIFFALVFLFILLPMAGILDIVGTLRILVVQLISYAGYAIAYLFGRL